MDEIANAGVATLYQCRHYGMFVTYPSTATLIFGSRLTDEQQKQQKPVETIWRKEPSLERGVANLQSLVAKFYGLEKWSDADDETGVAIGFSCS